MAEFYQVLSQTDKTRTEEIRQFFPNIIENQVQYVINPDEQQSFQGQQILVTSEPLMIVDGQTPIQYQTQPPQQYIVQETGSVEYTDAPQQQIFYMEDTDNSQQSEHTIVEPQPPIVLNHLAQATQVQNLQVDLQKTVSVPQTMQVRPPQIQAQLRHQIQPIRQTLPQINQLQQQRQIQVQVPVQHQQIQQVRTPGHIQQRPMQQVQPQQKARNRIQPNANRNTITHIPEVHGLHYTQPQIKNSEITEADSREAVALPDGSIITLAQYKKLMADKAATTTQPQVQERIETQKRKNIRTANAARGIKMQANRGAEQQQQQFIPRQPPIKTMNPQHCLQQPHSTQAAQQIVQNRQQTVLQQQSPMPQKYIIQPQGVRPHHSSQPLPACELSQQLRDIIESNPLSEEHADSIRMLVLLASGEQRLITFTLPKEACTIQEILEEVGVPFKADTKIDVAEYTNSSINYVVTVGCSVASFSNHCDEMTDIDDVQSNQSSHDSDSQNVKDAPLQIPEPPKEIPKYIPGKLAVCMHCGYLSEDFNKCLRCKRKLPEDVKSVATSSTPKGNIKRNDRCGHNIHDKKTSLPIKSNGTVKQQVGPQNSKKKGKPKIQDNEPVILTLSSDEEEDPEKGKKATEEVGLKQTESPVKKEPSVMQIQQDCLEQQTIAKDVDVPDIFTNIICRTIRIGSYRFMPDENLIIKSTGLLLKVPHPKDPADVKVISIAHKQIVKVLVNFQKMLPVIFYYVFPSVGQHIREQLGMTEGSEPYFDPLSTEETYKRITILPENIPENIRNVFKQIYSNPCNIMDELTTREANDILVKTCPKELTTKAINTSFTEIKQLLIYPPGKGGLSINTEDYICLAQDQFLNDVIIDFYLKYLVLNLPVEQQEKVHVFSTFFYKRLTTKPFKASRRLHPVELDPTLTPAQKRHARVKNWTKHVNLFEKNFIIIPINENCHWFLAIICFPGLDGPCTIDGKIVHIEPKEKKRKSAVSSTIGSVTITQVKVEKEEKPISCEDGEASDKDEAEGDESELDSEEESTEEVVVPVEPDKRQPIKQPCILIFDSLAGASRSRVVATLRDYLTCEYKAKLGIDKIFNKDVIKGACPKVPQQTNFTDCGLYLLQYVEQFFKDPIKDYRIPISQLKMWFDEIIVTKKREDISFLIKDLMKEYKKDPSVLPDIAFPTLNGKLVQRTPEEEEEFDEDEMPTNEEALNETMETEESEGIDKTAGEEQDETTVQSSQASVVNSDFEQTVENVEKLKPDSSEIKKLSNRDTMSYLKAKRIIRHKNAEGTDTKKIKLN